MYSNEIVIYFKSTLQCFLLRVHHDLWNYNNAMVSLLLSHAKSTEMLNNIDLHSQE